MPPNNPNSSQYRHLTIPSENSGRTSNTERENTQEKRSRVIKAIAGGLALSLALGIGNMFAKNEEARALRTEERLEAQAEMYNVVDNELTIDGGENGISTAIRSGPAVIESKDDGTSNKLGEIGQDPDAQYNLKLKDGATVYRYRDENDPNGAWLGIGAEDIKDDDNPVGQYIEEAVEKDETGVVWINTNYVEGKFEKSDQPNPIAVEETESPQP